MRGNLPSVKTLRAITSYPRELRMVLECATYGNLVTLLCGAKPFGKRSRFDGFNIAGAGYRCTCGMHRGQYHNPPSFHELKMSMADELCETCGVEYIPHGHNDKSPAIEYCNAGDTYTTTLLFVNGRYRVGSWGDIVERGHYD